MRRDCGEQTVDQFAIILFPTLEVNDGIEVKCDLVARIPAIRSRRQPSRNGSGLVFVTGLDPGRIDRPSHHGLPLVTERQQSRNRVGFGLQLQNGVAVRGEELNQRLTVPGQVIQCQAVCKLSRSDAERPARTGKEHLVQLPEKIVNVGVHNHVREVQIGLQIAIAAFHVAIAGEINHEVVTADIGRFTAGLLPRTRLEESPLMAS